jgi:hypothetical protein
MIADAKKAVVGELHLMDGLSTATASIVFVTDATQSCLRINSPCLVAMSWNATGSTALIHLSTVVRRRVSFNRFEAHLLR